MSHAKPAFWNIIFGLFFAVLVIQGSLFLYNGGFLMRALPLGDFALMAIAIFRLVRLSSYDTVTQFMRDWLLKGKPGTFLGTLSQLIHCPWCAGLWFAFFVVFFYYATPLAWPVILILALAGVASFIQVLANLVGWSAEAKKREVVGAGNSTGTCG